MCITGIRNPYNGSKHIKHDGTMLNFFTGLKHKYMLVDVSSTLHRQKVSHQSVSYESTTEQCHSGILQKTSRSPE